MHDGQNVFQDNDAIGGTSLELESYLDENELEVIVVGIDQNSEKRLNEYCPWFNGEYSKKILGSASLSGGKGIQYVDFIVNELKPSIDNTYRTIKEKIEKLIQDSDLSLIESFYLDCGTKEAGDNEIINKEFFDSNKAVYELLKKKIPNAKFEMINDTEHSYLNFRERVPKIISFLKNRGFISIYYAKGSMFIKLN